MEIRDILKSRRQELGLTQDDIANETGVSKATVSRWENGFISNMRRDRIAKLAKILQINPAIIIGLKSRDEADLGKIEPPTLKSFAYTFIPAKVSAGTLEDIEAVYDCPKMNVPDAMLGKYAHDRNVVFMGVNGESMNNIIENGAIIAVKTDVERGSLKDGDIVVASSNGSYAVKHFINDVENERIILRPDSTDKTFTDTVIPYENADSLKIFGKVVIYSVVL